MNRGLLLSVSLLYLSPLFIAPTIHASTTDPAADCHHLLRLKHSCEKNLVQHKEDLIQLERKIHRLHSSEIPQREKFLLESDHQLMRLESLKDISGQLKTGLDETLIFMQQQENLMEQTKVQLINLLPLCAIRLRSYLIEHTITIEDLIAEKAAEITAAETRGEKSKTQQLQMEFQVIQEVSLFTSYAREKYHYQNPQELEEIIEQFFAGKEHELLAREISPMTLQLIQMAISMEQITFSAESLFRVMKQNMKAVILKIFTDQQKMNENLQLYQQQYFEEQANNKNLQVHLKQLKNDLRNLKAKKNYKENAESRVYEKWNQQANEKIKKFSPGRCEREGPGMTLEAENGGSGLCQETFFNASDYMLCVENAHYC